MAVAIANDCVKRPHTRSRGLANFCQPLEAGFSIVKQKLNFTYRRQRLKRIPNEQPAADGTLKRERIYRWSSGPERLKARTSTPALSNLRGDKDPSSPLAVDEAEFANTR